MAVDKSYGSGYKNTGMKKPVAPKAASAKLRRKGGNVAAKKYTSITTSKAKMLPGTSDYVAQENAARKQLGVAGLAARNRQLPRAARATARGLVREVTGVDVSRKGIKVDPFGLAMALPLGKVVKAAGALRAAGKFRMAEAVEGRLAAKELGSIRAGNLAGKRGPTMASNLSPRTLASGQRARVSSESVFPRLPSKGGDALSLLRGSRDIRTFDKYADLTNEGAGRFKSQNLLDTMIQGSKTRSGMNRVKTASEVAKKLAKYKTPKRGR